MADNSKRLDIAVFERGFAESRARAGALIMAGQVYVNGQKVTKAGYSLKTDDVLEVRGDKLKYVSRGGLKLEKAMTEFELKLDGLVCMDVGASTGGFTDCMLQNGAEKVYSVDVGYGQLAWKLRSDERVVNMERTNFRYLTENDIGEMLDFASVDVSFISLKIILPVLYDLLKDGAASVCLIKPQFEAGRDKVGKKGVVRELSTHKEVVRGIVSFAAETGFSVKGLSFSPVKGPEGNIEYLMYVVKDKDNCADIQSLLDSVDDTVERSHEALDKEGKGL